jgi:hypothetical protein
LYDVFDFFLGHFNVFLVFFSFFFWSLRCVVWRQDAFSDIFDSFFDILSSFSILEIFFRHPQVHRGESIT